MKKTIRLIPILILFLTSAGISLYFLRDLPAVRVLTVNLFPEKHDQALMDQAGVSFLYEQLNEAQKTVYRTLYYKTSRDEYEYAFAKDISLADVSRALDAFTAEYPAYWYLDIEAFVQYTNDALSLSCILASFEQERNEIMADRILFEERAAEILRDAGGRDTLETIRYVHDSVLDALEYNPSCRYSQDIRSSMLYGEAACAGYAGMFQYLLQKCGIQCLKVTGIAGTGNQVNHAWNLLKYDNHWYWADPTFDDTGEDRYAYFLMSDAQIAADHSAETFVYPGCEDGSLYRKEDN